MSQLPIRVQAAIKAQDEVTERLIGWVQLGVFAVLGAFYFIAPKTFTAATYRLAREQGYRPRTDTSARPDCRVDGVDAPINLVVLHA